MRVSFDPTRLVGVSLRGTRLFGASLRGTRLVGASLHGTRLVGASLLAATLGVLTGCGTDPSGSPGAGTGGTGTADGSGGSDSASSGGTGGSNLGSAGGTHSGGTHSGGASSGGSGGAPPDGGGTPGVTISGRQLRVNGAPFHIQGVCWNPVPRGGTHPTDLDYAAAAPLDIPLMAAAGINAVRTYEPLTDRAVLDALFAAGIRVLNTVYPYGGAPPSRAGELANTIKDHPAILLWVVGNEWNYNGLYVGLDHAAALTQINAAAAAIRAVDDTHPISTVYGELPSADTLAAMPDIDIWGLNVYRGLGFGDLFTDWAALSSKPFYLAEYGADAWNATLDREDPTSQADAASTLTILILDHSSALTTSGTCAGGTLFEWSDEWWKDASGSPDQHDIGGVAPGGGPHPDLTFNEEWWGLVTIDRQPRPAYHELTRLYRP